MACLVPSLLGAAVHAQPVGPEPTLREVPKDRIPLYYLVHQFFSMMAHYREAKPLQYETRLWDLGIEPASQAAAALDRAVEAAASILARLTTDPSLEDSEERFLAFQERSIREQSRDLAEVYGGLLADLLLADLKQVGGHPDRLRKYLDQTMRERVSLWVDAPPGREPVDALLADRNVQAVLPFEELAEAFYRSGASNVSTKGE